MFESIEALIIGGLFGILIKIPKNMKDNISTVYSIVLCFMVLSMGIAIGQNQTNFGNILESLFFAIMTSAASMILVYLIMKRGG